MSCNCDTPCEKCAKDTIPAPPMTTIRVERASELIHCIIASCDPSDEGQAARDELLCMVAESLFGIEPYR